MNVQCSHPIRPSAVRLAVACLLAAALTSTAAQAQPFSWVTAAPSPVERFEGAAAVSGGKVYVFGGFADGLVAQVRSDVYDPASDTWTRIADLPVANTHIGFAAAGGKVYFAGGFVGNHPGVATDAVFVYDTLTDAFTEGPPLPARRAGGALVHHEGRLHFVGGLLPDRRTDASDHYVLDLSDLGAGWTTAAPIPKALNHFNGVSVGGLIYAVGGQTGHDGPNDDTRTLQAYDPATDTWTQRADLPEDRSHAEPGTFVLDGRIVIAGGKSDGTPNLATIRVYDPETDTWSAFGELPTALRAPVVQAVGETIVATTGSKGTNSQDATYTAPVEAAQPRVLFVRGGDRTGGFFEAGNDAERTEHLGDIYNVTTGGGNHGWGFLRRALEADGFVVEQITEGAETPSGPAEGLPVPFDQLNLGAYDAVVLGSNNAVYGAAAVDAVEQFVRDGGAVLFISDANFGGDWADAPSSDQQFLDRFGLVMNQDQGTYTLSRGSGDFRVPDHPIFDGVDAFDGEGVSPISLGPLAAGVTATVLARAEGKTRVNAPPYGANRQGASRQTTVGDGSLVVAEAGAGRIAGHFDRNTFFNPGGAGTSLSRLDNERYALNLFGWLVGSSTDGPPDPPEPPAPGEVVFALNAGGGAFTAADGTAYVADAGASGGRTYTASGAISGTTDDALYQSERWGTFAYAVPVEPGTYEVTLRLAEIYFTAPGQRVFSVTAEGQPFVQGLDLFAEVGRDAAYDVTETVSVTDGTLDLAFSASVNNAKLAAVVVRTAGGAPAAWQETFAGLPNGTTSDPGPTAWTTEPPPSGTFAVQNGVFVANNNKGEGVWRSGPIEIGGTAGVSLTIQSGGSMETSGPSADHLRVFYVLDGGAEVPVAQRAGNFNGDAPETVGVSGLGGSTLQLVIRAKTTGGSETYTWDDVSVTSGAAPSAAALAGLATAPEAQPTRVYPNPTAAAATLAYALAEPADVRLEVYDALGRRVAVLADGPHEAGSHRAPFDGAGLAGGVYHWRLVAGGRVEAGQFVLAR